MQLSKNTLTSIIDALPIGTILTNKDRKIVCLNHKAEDLFGYDKDELLGCSVDILVPERYLLSHQKSSIEYMKAPSLRSMSNGRILPGLRKSGEEIQIQIGLTPLTVEKTDYVLASILEVSNDILKIAAFNDSLTNLPTRDLFMALSENSRNLAIRNKAPLSLMFIDLDKFKIVNDNYGHHIGDLVLCEVANTLRGNIRKIDIAGRFGGDEFIMCLYGIENSDDLKKIGKDLIRKITSIRNIVGNKIDISASIGAVSVTRPDSLSLDEMVNMADQLMYKAKKTSKGKVILENV